MPGKNRKQDVSFRKKILSGQEYFVIY